MIISGAAQSKLYSIACLLMCISILSCSSDSTGSSDMAQSEIEYLYASQCDLSETNRPEACAPDAPYLIGKYKVGDVYLHIPRSYLRQPAQDVRDIYRVSHSVCWPGLDLPVPGRERCARFTERIIFYMTPAPLPWNVPRITKRERLAEKTEHYYTGPFQIEGTGIDEYRHRNENGVAPIFSFQAEDDVRIAQCSQSTWGRCIVATNVLPGLSIRYEFGVNLIRDWPKIDAVVRSLVASFIVQADSD